VFPVFTAFFEIKSTVRIVAPLYTLARIPARSLPANEGSLIVQGQAMIPGTRYTPALFAGDAPRPLGRLFFLSFFRFR